MTGKGLFLPGVLAAFLVVSVMLLPIDSFWCMDEANRFLQTHALTLKGAAIPPALPYPGGESLANPELHQRLRPLPAQYGFIRNSRLYSQYNPLPALMAAPFYALLGQRGIYLPPLLGGIALTLVLAALLKKSGISRRNRLLLAFFCTPIPFYSLTFFSHSIALVLGLLSLIMLRKGLTVTAFIPGVLAVSMRPEMILAFPLVLLFQGKPPRFNRIALGFIISATLFLLIQKGLTGNWLGTHLAGSFAQSHIYGTVPAWLPSRLYILRRGFVNAMPGYGVWGLLLGGTLWGLWGLSLARRDKPSGTAAALAGLGLSLIPLAAFFIRGLSSTDTMDVQNPLVVFPLLWLARPPGKALGLAGALLLAMLLVMSPMHAEDVSWGLRHGLFLFLLLCLFSRKHPPRRLVQGVMAVGVLATITSLSLLSAKRNRGAELTGMLLEAGAPVITTSWEQPQELAPLIVRGTPVLHASTTHDLLAALHTFGHREPLVMVRRESVGLLFAVVEAAGMHHTFTGSGPPGDPVTNVLVFRCGF
jgi:hypothetical protein